MHKTPKSCAGHNTPRISDTEDSKTTISLSMGPFSRAFFPPFQWGHVSQNLEKCSFPPEFFLPPKWGSPLSVLELFTPEQGNFSRFSSEIFFYFYFVPFSRASPPPSSGGTFPKI